MSFTEEKRDIIKKYILEKIRCDDNEYVKKTIENFQVSATTVKRYLKECVEREWIVSDANRRSGYALVVCEERWELENDGSLEEDTFYFECIFPMLKNISLNAQNIWYYTFTEIMNNAIEHSKGEKIYCCLKKDYLYTEISITDNGVGIFNNITQYANEKLGMKLDPAQAVMELYKGKMTTNPGNHSGEGIFFSSKMLSEFALWSQNMIYSYRCNDRDRFVDSHLIAYATKIRGIGTMAIMKLENDTKRTTREVFDLFAPMEEGFVKTFLPMKELCPLGNPVARSQARRILQRLEQFKEVVFDFSEIEFMGQGFADEVFRVFQNKYPDIVLTPINANETVLGMIQHVKRQ